MAAFESRDLESLALGHPCERCKARSEAACRVLGCETLAKLKRLGWTIKLGSGQTLFREGDTAGRVFTLTRGSLKLYKLLADGRRQIVGFMYPGDFLGFSSDEEHAFTAELLEDGELCSFPRGLFASFLAEHPSMEHELFRKAAHELGAAQLQLVILGRKTASERLASFLLYLADRIGDDCVSVVDLPMSRSDIADYLGLTKETISRVFSSFRASRLIRFRTLNQLEILSRAALEQMAEDAHRVYA